MMHKYSNPRMQAIADRAHEQVKRGNEILESARAEVITGKRERHEFTMCKIADLSPEDQAKVIRPTRSTR